MTSGIYCIENLIDNKKYIGWATTIEKRFKTHYRELNNNKHKNNYLQNAWNKYGGENFKFWTIAEYPRDETILKLMEIYFICYYDSFCRDGGGYNLTRGGDGSLGYIPSEATKKLLSALSSGENNSFYGKTHSKEAKKLMSENHWDNSGKNSPMRGKNSPMRGKHLSEETILKMSGKNNHNFGIHLSEEAKKLLSEINLGENHPKFGKKSKNTSSQYFGVYRIGKKGVYWRCIIGKKYLGQFKTEIEAVHAYDKYVIENNINRPLNFPEDYNVNNKNHN